MYTDLVAKLLSNENIDVVRSQVRTASFDVDSRVLTLPIWSDISSSMEDMLICHEVGHALFTPQSLVENIDGDQDLFHYVNVLEDVRVERLMKRTYPGTRKSFREGYEEVNKMNFFGVAAMTPHDF